MPRSERVHLWPAQLLHDLLQKNFDNPLHSEVLNALGEMMFIASRISITTSAQDSPQCPGSAWLIAPCGRSLIASRITFTKSAEARRADWVQTTKNRTPAVEASESVHCDTTCPPPTFPTVYHHPNTTTLVTPDPPRPRRGDKFRLSCGLSEPLIRVPSAIL